MWLKRDAWIVNYIIISNEEAVELNKCESNEPNLGSEICFLFSCFSSRQNWGGNHVNNIRPEPCSRVQSQPS